MPLRQRAKILGVEYRLKSVSKGMSRDEKNKIHSWNTNVVTVAAKKKSSRSQTASFDTAVLEVEAFEVETDDNCASEFEVASQLSCVPHQPLHHAAHRSMAASGKCKRSDEDEIDLLVKKIKAAESLGDGLMVARLKLKLENI